MLITTLLEAKPPATPPHSEPFLALLISLISPVFILETNPSYTNGTENVCNSHANEWVSSECPIFSAILLLRRQSACNMVCITFGRARKVRIWYIYCKNNR